MQACVVISAEAGATRGADGRGGTRMKLATALSERADLQNKIAELGTRLNNNAKVQEGETPSEDPQALLAELDGCLARLQELMVQINLTNSRVQVSGVTITELIARRDVLNMKIRRLRSFLDSASEKVDRYSNKEIKVLSTVDVAALQKQLDGQAKALRELDDKLQEANWTTELM